MHAGLAETYELHDDPPSAFSRWIVPALIISILLHIIFLMWARGIVIEKLSGAYYEKLVPRAFRLERVEIDARLLDPQPGEEKQEASAPTAVKLPEDRISFEAMMNDVRATPAAPKVSNPMLAEKPSAEPKSYASTVQEAEMQGAQSVVKDLDAIRKEIIVDRPETPGRPLLELGKPGDAEANPAAKKGAASGAAMPGFSNLDDLLAQTGPLRPETAPILMPADFLFDYDSYALRQGAIADMRKLGLIIQKNPQVDFLIEGHTDSFGSDDYNLELSRLRAEAVKAWLVHVVGIDPDRISTRGYGETRLIAPATGSIDDQQINRRVEIVIRSAGPRR